MISNLFKFRIPTIFGLGVIVLGLGVGVYLTLQNQTFITRASPETKPENIVISNIEDASITISWTTRQKVSGLVKYGTGSTDENTALDSQGSIPGNLHFVTLTNLTPKTSYQYKIVSGKNEADVDQFITASTTEPNNRKPLTGSVLDGEAPLAEGLVYLKISDEVILSTTIKSLGNFIIPLTKISTPDTQTGRLEVLTADNRKAAATINLQGDGPVGPLKLGQDLDLTKQIVKQAINNQFDLNDDGTVNTSDYSLLLKNFSKNPKDKKFDLNLDGVVDKLDADLLLREIQKGI